MKKKIFLGATTIAILTVILFCLTGCGSETKESETNESEVEENTDKTNPIDVHEIYLEVLANKREYVDESNEKNYISKMGELNKITYTFVDMDQDQKDEMVMLYEKIYGEDYIVFKYEEDSNTVYGFEVVLRGMLGLKTNGYYIASGGATVGGLCKSTFDKNIRKETILAEMDGNMYSIGEERVSKSEYDAYIKAEYDSKDDVTWIEYKANSENANSTGNFEEGTYSYTYPKLGMEVDGTTETLTFNNGKITYKGEYFIKEKKGTYEIEGNQLIAVFKEETVWNQSLGKEETNPIAETGLYRIIDNGLEEIGNDSLTKIYIKQH